MQLSGQVHIDSVLGQAPGPAQGEKKDRFKKGSIRSGVYLRDSPRSLVLRHAASLGMEENDLSADITLLKF